MSVLYKRLVLFVAVVCLCMASRCFDNGLCYQNEQVRYTAFLQNGEQITYNEPPYFNFRGAYERVDFLGNEKDCERFLDKYFATVSFSESVENQKIIYAYSPLISNIVYVHGRAVNMMVACDGRKIVVGSPLIKGSY
ncbi:MAG: hypothetical protein J6B79_06590 [Clostridia bacterium]|nr:hypothetical protein [Clostridia bacterium]MBQ7223955.1 hypothetical protein [Clostridia bacterium]